MTDKKLTTESIVQGLDGADVFLRDLAGSTHTSLNEYDIGILFNIAHLCGDAADFINRQKAEIERLTDTLNATIAGQETLQKYIAEQKAEIEELVYKLECLLCHATGSKLSKHTYPLNIMYSAVNDEVQEYCEEAEAYAIKEFAERLKAKFIPSLSFNEDLQKVVTVKDIDNLVKEMVGDDNENL